MNNQIQQIQQYNFHDSIVRIHANGDTVEYCARDIAATLGYTNTSKAISDHCRGVTNRYPIVDSLGRTQEATFISEGDVYRLIVSSQLPAAIEFEHWLFDEVLPSIRKHGGYMAGQETMSPEQMLAASMRWLESRIAEQQGQIASQQAQLDAQAPKVLFADAVSTSKRCILVGELAKILRQNGVDMGEKRLFAWLREHGYLMKRNGITNYPTQRSMDLKLFEIKETPIVHSDGHTTLSITTKVTPKGQIYFTEKFLGKRAETAA